MTAMEELKEWPDKHGWKLDNAGEFRSLVRHAIAEHEALRAQRDELLQLCQSSVNVRKDE